MELTKEQVQQINNFLEAIGVEYIDIRFEMVDHIASEIENKVSNIPAFYEDQRLHTHFLKYMLSRKEELKKRYDSILKKKFWSDILFIAKDSIIQALKPLNFLLLGLTVAFSFFLIKLNIKYAIYFPLVLFITHSIYSSIIYKKFKKRHGELKIAHSYTYAVSLVGILAINFNPLYNLGKNTTTLESYYFYFSLLAFVINYLVFMSFNSKKEMIKKKYNYLLE